MTPALRPVAGAVLGIESSCDETAAAVLDADGRVLAEAVLSQGEHAKFGGVVPELAARAHLAHLPDMVAEVMRRAGLAYRDLGAVAATAGPGLIGGLIVGSGVARGIALAAGIPFIAVNHLEAHALSPLLPELVDGARAEFPYLLLLVSGGHCQCVAVDGLGQYRRLGGTIDDAVGEAFDKVGKLLGLGWPGGPAVERLAARGNAANCRLPRPLFGRPGCDFSFSGLKTAVAHKVAAFGGTLAEADAADIAAGFQEAVTAVLEDRVAHALDMLPAATALVLAGGVAANAAIRTTLAALAARRGVALAAPPLRLCTDNAVMVAWAGLLRLRAGALSPLDAPSRPRWPLDAPDMRL